MKYIITLLVALLMSVASYADVVRVRYMSSTPKEAFDRNYKILKRGKTHTLIKSLYNQKYMLIPNKEFVEDGWEINYIASHNLYTINIEEIILKHFADI